MTASAFSTAFVRMLLWMAGMLLLIHVITWNSPLQDGETTVPQWAEFLVWSLFIVPVIPAMIAGVAKLQGDQKWKPIVLAVIFGVLTPILGVTSIVFTLLIVDGNVDLGPDNENISAFVILSTLFATVTVVAVATALIRFNHSRNH